MWLGYITENVVGHATDVWPDPGFKEALPSNDAIDYEQIKQDSTAKVMTEMIAEALQERAPHLVTPQ
jgi:hypothetical protein